MMIPCMGMMLGAAFFGLVFYVVRQWSRVRLRELEIKELELRGGE